MSSRISRKEEGVSLITKNGKTSQQPPTSATLKDNDNSVSMIKLAILSILAVAIACSVFGYSGAAPAKSSPCQNDNECKEGQYCYNKYGPSSCTDCLNCASYNRKPGIGQCAKKRAECGECLPGFVEVGYQCSQHAKDITTSKYSNSVLYAPPKKPTSAHAAIHDNILAIKNVGKINHTGETQSDYRLMPPGHNIWIVISTTAILSVMVVMGLVMMYCRRPVVVRAGPRSKDEEMELQPMSGISSSTQSSGGGDQAPTADLSPSAPPEELIKNRHSYWSGSYQYQHAGNYAWNKGQNFTGPTRIVTPMADSERIVPESYQQANPFSAGNAAGEEAQEFLAQHNLDQEAIIVEDGPNPALELIEQELRQLPAAVELPPQQIPEVDPENPEAAANKLIEEESMDLSGIVQNDDDNDMEVDEGIPDEDNEMSLEIRFDLAAIIPADHLSNSNNPAGGNESTNDSGIAEDDNDAVVPDLPSLSLSAQDGRDNIPGDTDNNNNTDGQNRLSVNQLPAEIAEEFRNLLNVQLINPDDWMAMSGNEGHGHEEE